MGLAISTCFDKAKDGVEVAQEKVVSVICCRNGRRGAGKSSSRYRYGSLAGGKYDESDDEDSRSILYNNNLLLDDDDDEEEQIVILTNTKEKTAKPEQRTHASAASRQTSSASNNVDHSVFKEGQGLLDMMTPTAINTASAPASAPAAS